MTCPTSLKSPQPVAEGFFACPEGKPNPAIISRSTSYGCSWIKADLLIIAGLGPDYNEQITKSGGRRGKE
jgi:hypothetical protein